MKCKTLMVVVLIATAIGFMFSHRVDAQSEKPANEQLVIVWSSADREVALNMVFMYATPSRQLGMWDDITLVVWGPSAKLLADDEELQIHIKHMIGLGVVVKACKLCADHYGVSYKLEELGITVKYMKELTDYIKEGRNILTF
ncbi:MAG: DsrE family protein [Deltaproteobacteria bacterium]